MRWRTKAGDELEARLGEPMTKDFVAHAWRTALDPKGEWIPRCSRPPTGASPSAPSRRGRRRSRDRLRPDPGAGVCGHLASADGEAPDRGPLRRPGRVRAHRGLFRGDERCMVAVRMVSEGVDVPRLVVGVYATSTSTPLFFAQVVDVLRARRRARPRRFFLPVGAGGPRPRVAARGAARPRARPQPNPDDIGQLWAEEQTLHRRGQPRRQGRRRARPGRLRGARVRRALRPRALRQAAVGQHAQIGSEDEEEYLGLPGLLEPDQVRRCSASGRAARSRRPRRAPRPRCRWPRTARSRRSARSSTTRLDLRPTEGTAARQRAHGPAARLRRTRPRRGLVRPGHRAHRQGPALARRPTLTPSRRNAVHESVALQVPVDDLRR